MLSNLIKYWAYVRHIYICQNGNEVVNRIES